MKFVFVIYHRSISIAIISDIFLEVNVEKCKAREIAGGEYFRKMSRIVSVEISMMYHRWKNHKMNSKFRCLNTARYHYTIIIIVWVWPSCAMLSISVVAHVQSSFDPLLRVYVLYTASSCRSCRWTSIISLTAKLCGAMRTRFALNDSVSHRNNFYWFHQIALVHIGSIIKKEFTCVEVNWFARNVRVDVREELAATGPWWNTIESVNPQGFPFILLLRISFWNFTFQQRLLAEFHRHNKRRNCSNANAHRLLDATSDNFVPSIEINLNVNTQWMQRYANEI